MKRLYEWKLSALFTIAVFITQSISSIIFPTFTIIALKMGYITNPKPIFMLYFITITSIVTGIFFSKVIGKRILKPITDLSDASSLVAKGDFYIQLQEIGCGKEIREMIHSFNIMTNELKNIETLRNDFVANVSHEFKTPLSVINGYATLLQDETISTEERNNYIDKIISNSKRLSKLTENVLLLSKLENQDILLDKTYFSLDEQIRNDILSLEQLWEEKKLSLDIELESIRFYGNKNMLSLVWCNLLSNAIKFTPNGGIITIKLNNEGSNILVCVEDTGIGIAEETRKHIFEKFYCGDKSRHSGGNGLGLTLTKRIVWLCGGTIEVQSEKDKGTNFLVRLPYETKTLSGNSGNMKFRKENIAKETDTFL
ncbi:HAMP domain-containing sensor histidine kinase [Anaerotignum sp.]|uniref:HAMP domain-containing sensor histidine kinase n=1 Tax=Anaerotignum sp. TaxID=2039241 RepID=UPI0027151E1D|nr:HAMP domain-containing sensor histidine kinase [Anaerotignum sp.]